MRHLVGSLVVSVQLLSSSCLSLPTAGDAHISYATVPSTWPDAATCLNGNNPAIAKEVLNGSLRTVVIAGGNSPISDADWEHYSPSLGNTKNSDRHVLFTSSCFVRSPELPANCVGEACRHIVELDGHTWVALSKIDAADCVPSGGSCSPAKVADGQLAFIVTEKCHEMHFTGDVIFLNGPQGEKAIMHATADGVPKTNVALPAGWTLSRETLTTEFVLRPFGGGEACFYNIIRDARAQSYHQFQFAGPRYP